MYVHNVVDIGSLQRQFPYTHLEIPLALVALLALRVLDWRSAANAAQFQGLRAEALDRGPAGPARPALAVKVVLLGQPLAPLLDGVHLGEKAEYRAVACK